jgi:hypothetical protein
MNIAPIALIALIPMITGPLPQEPEGLTVSLCGGGEITISLGDEAPEDKRDCHQQACHAGTCREKSKRADKLPN